MNTEICSTVRKNLYCSYALELLAAEVLNRYADTVRSESLAELVLRIIALDSRKHAEYIELVAKTFNLFEQTDCEHVVGEPWRRLKGLLDRLKLGDKIDLDNFIEGQLWLERAVGEETYQKVLLPLVSQAARSECVSDRVAKVLDAILNKIAGDENWHEKMLQALRETYS